MYSLNCVESVYQYRISALSQKVREYTYLVSRCWWGRWWLNSTVLYVQLFDLNDLIRTCIDRVFWNSIIVHYLIQDGIFMSWSILHCIGILWLRIISVKTVLLCPDYRLSWSRRYFHVSIKRVFSTRSEWTWPLFGQVSYRRVLVFSVIVFPSESTYETACFEWVLLRNFLLTSNDIGKGILRTKFF